MSLPGLFSTSVSTATAGLPARVGATGATGPAGTESTVIVTATSATTSIVTAKIPVTAVATCPVAQPHVLGGGYTVNSITNLETRDPRVGASFPTDAAQDTWTATLWSNTTNSSFSFTVYATCGP